MPAHSGDQAYGRGGVLQPRVRAGREQRSAGSGNASASSPAPVRREQGRSRSAGRAVFRQLPATLRQDSDLQYNWTQQGRRRLLGSREEGRRGRIGDSTTV